MLQNLKYVDFSVAIEEAEKSRRARSDKILKRLNELVEAVVDKKQNNKDATKEKEEYRKLRSLYDKSF